MRTGCGIALQLFHYGMMGIKSHELLPKGSCSGCSRPRFNCSDSPFEMDGCAS